MKKIIAITALLLLSACKNDVPDIVARMRQTQQEEIDDFNRKIDLAIARSDDQAIEFAQHNLDRVTKACQNLADYTEACRQQEKAEAELDKVIDSAARHRHH